MNFKKIVTFSCLSSTICLAIYIRWRFFQTSTLYLAATADEILSVFIARDIASGARPLLFWGAPYQFPLESYLLAPFVHLLPSNAYGARLFFAIMGSAAVAGFCLLQLVTGKGISRLAGLLIILIPSTYLIILQSGYFIPEHTATMHFAWIIPMSVVLVLRNPSSWVFPLVTGILSGFALSTHLLSSPLVAASLIVVCLGSSLKNAAKNTLCFIPGFLLGLVPYLATYSDAKQMASEVTARYSLTEALPRVYSSLLSSNISVVLGFDASIFPDHQHWGGLVPELVPYLLITCLLILLSISANSALKVVKQLTNKQWPALGIEELFVGTVWACIFAALLSKRSAPGEYRYFLPIAWCFPYIIAHAMSISPRLVRNALFGFVLAVCTLQVVHISEIGKEWRKPIFRSLIAGTHSIEPVIHYLDTQGINRCYSGFWFAYRFSFETNSRIICSQAYNERFPGWPLRFKEEIDRSTNIAYVLSNTRHARLKAKDFLGMLRYHKIDATITEIFPFFVFHGFSYKDVENSQQVPKKAISLHSDNNEKSLKLLLDDNKSTNWISKEKQKFEQFLSISFDQPRRIHRLRIYFAEGKRSNSPKYKVEITRDGKEYQLVKEDVRPLADRITIGSSHPYFFSENRQDIPIDPSDIVGIRVSIVYARPEHHWEIAEIQVLEDSRTISQQAIEE